MSNPNPANDPENVLDHDVECDHDDVDDFFCLDCGADLTEEILSKAYDRAKDSYKYGE